jgi:hypothetical protein
MFTEQEVRLSVISPQTNLQVSGGHTGRDISLPGQRGPRSHSMDGWSYFLYCPLSPFAHTT